MKKNMIIDSVLNILGTGIPLIILQIVIHPLLAKDVGGDDYGLIVTLISIFTLLSVPIGNSINNLKLINLNTENDSRNNYYRLIIVYTGFSLIMLTTIITFNDFGIAYESYIFLILIIVINIIREYLIVEFRISRNYVNIFRNNIYYALGLIVGYGLFKYLDIWEIIFLIGYIFSLVHIIIVEKDKLLFSKKSIFKSYKSDLWRNSAFLISGSLLKNFVQYADKIIIFPLIGSKGVAIYYSAAVMGKLLVTFINPVNGVILSYLANKKTLSRSTIKKVFFFTAIVSLGMLIFTNILSPFLIKLLYPQWYEDAMKYVFVLSIATVCNMVTGTLNPFNLKYNSLSWQLKMNAFQLVIYLVSVILLFSEYGLMGFCVALVIANSYKLLITIFLLIKNKNFV